MEKVTPITTELALKLCLISIGDESEDIRQLLNEKQAEAFTIGQCCFITRFEQSRNKKELIVMYAEGKGLLEASWILKAIAKNHGCNSIRMHTSRKGLFRYMSDFGWKQQEIIYQMSI